MNTDTVTGKMLKRGKIVSVRTAGFGYLATAFLALFFSAFLDRLDYSLISILVLCTSWMVLALFAASDRLYVDGRKLQRSGAIPRFVNLFTGSGRRLRIAHIEQVETAAYQRYKRGGNVVYSYRTTIRGRERRFEITSHSRGFREFITALLAGVPDDVLDNRSIELRDYLAARSDVRSRAKLSEIPDSDVLEGSLKRSRQSVPQPHSPIMMLPDPEKAEKLRRLGNELRIAGFLLQSVEAFRRAALLQPKNAWLLFDYGRCLLSCAASERDDGLERRAFAMMRLAERRAGDDRELLARLGESYFHAGNWERASIVFRKATDTVGASFRAMRGMAEIALREGKFAHVIHNFSIANDLTNSPSLKRWTNSEIEYFTRLNSDEEYMELEISRLNLIDTLSRLAASTIRIAGLGIAVIFAGALLDDSLVADAGWAIGLISLILCSGAVVFKGILAARISTETIDEE
ncbi:MAG: tetratricopeptide repeat protein [Pyrinomonadaceae bacterium]